MKRLIALALLVVALGLAACGGEPTAESGLALGTGTLHSYGGECTGIWLLRPDAGHQFELTDLPAEFQHQELRVRFVLKRRTDRVSTCMVGAGADILSMTRL